MMALPAIRRVVKWLGTVPAVGICTHCDRNFKVPLDSLKSASDAQESLRKSWCRSHEYLWCAKRSGVNWPPAKSGCAIKMKHQGRKLSFCSKATKRGFERRPSNSGSTFINTKPLERSAKAFSSQSSAFSVSPKPTQTTAK